MKGHDVVRVKDGRREVQCCGIPCVAPACPCVLASLRLLSCVYCAEVSGSGSCMFLSSFLNPLHNPFLQYTHLKYKKKPVKTIFLCVRISTLVLYLQIIYGCNISSEIQNSFCTLSHNITQRITSVSNGRDSTNKESEAQYQ